MRTKYLFLGVIFSFLGLVSQAQVYLMYGQGFETNDPVSYTVTNNSYEFSTTLRAGGDRSLRLKQTTTTDVSMVLCAMWHWNLTTFATSLPIWVMVRRFARYL